MDIESFGYIHKIGMPGSYSSSMFKTFKLIFQRGCLQPFCFVDIPCDFNFEYHRVFIRTWINTSITSCASLGTLLMGSDYVKHCLTSTSFWNIGAGFCIINSILHFVYLKYQHFVNDVKSAAMLKYNLPLRQ